MSNVSYEQTARALILHAGCLLVCQHDTEQFFHIPGGHIEPGETPERALHREIWEELAHPILALAKLGVLQTQWRRGMLLDGDLVYETAHVYAAQLGGALSGGVWHGTEPDLHVIWIPVGQLATAQIVPPQILPWVMVHPWPEAR